MSRRPSPRLGVPHTLLILLACGPHPAPAGAVGGGDSGAVEAPRGQVVRAEHAEHAEHGGHRHGGGHHRFEDPERWAKEFDSPERLAWQKPEAVIAGLGLAPDATIADVGAGTGAFAVRFARALPQGRVYANDVEPRMVEYLGQRAAAEGLSNLTPVLGEAGDPKLPPGLDLVFLCDVFHHIEDLPGFFGHVRTSLKEGGRLAIVDFKEDAPEDAPGPPRAMRVAMADVIARLEPLGFAVEQTDEALLEYQYVVVLRRR